MTSCHTPLQNFVPTRKIVHCFSHKKHEMSKRKGNPRAGDIVPRRTRTISVSPSHFSFIENGYLRQLYDQLHTNVLYSWLRGDLGPIDRPNVSRDYIWNLWSDLNDHGFFSARYIKEYYVDREMAFWHKVSPDTVPAEWREVDK